MIFSTRADFFVSEDAFVEFDVLFWAFGEKMPTCGQDFHCQCQRICYVDQVRFNIRDVLDKGFLNIGGSSCLRRKRGKLFGYDWAKRFFNYVWGECFGGGVAKAKL